VAYTLLPHSSNFSAVAMLNVSGKDQTLRHDTQIGVATPCQTGYVSMATDADMTCVGARQCAVDAIRMTINTARRSDCQTVSKLDRLVAQEGPLAARKGPSMEPSGPLAGREGQLVDPDRPLADPVWPRADRVGRSAV